MTNIDDIQNERTTRYGEFDEQARITQNIKDAMKDSKNWDILPPYMKEALEMTAHKIARILNGDIYYDDSWVDGSSYLDLVVKKLHEDNKNKTDKHYDDWIDCARFFQERKETEEQKEKFVILEKFFTLNELKELCDRKGWRIPTLKEVENMTLKDYIFTTEPTNGVQRCVISNGKKCFNVHENIHLYRAGVFKRN